MSEKRPINTERRYVSTIVWQDHVRIADIGDPGRQLYAVVDSSVKWLWREATKDFREIPVLYIETPTEASKTLKQTEAILNFLFKNGADRNSIVLAIGGGVTLDVTGFAASIFKRGIEWIAVPTTLLAQVDASVGGKTAVNHRTGKNSIGTFHPPSRVIIAPECAETWESIHRLEGIAEMFKIFLCFDHNAMKQLLVDPDDSTLTNRSIELKALVVDCDPWEQHLRAALNYGHTFGHALELELGLAHGLAVALGMRIENAVACCLGIMSVKKMKQIDSQIDNLGNKIDSTLGYQLPSQWPTFQSLLPLLRQDKKNIDGQIMLCLPDGEKNWPISKHDPRVKVSEDILRHAYEGYVATRSET